MEKNDSIDSLKQVINSLRQKLLSVHKMCEESNFQRDEAHAILKEGILDLIEIKRLNSIVQISCEENENECNKIKSNAGQENLLAQKYNFRLDIINHQINAIKNLPQLPEMNTLISNEKEMNMDDVKIEKLEQILLGRKRLNGELNELIKEKEKNKNELKTKEVYIKDIPKYIDNLENEVKKTKKLFNNDNKS